MSGRQSKKAQTDQVREQYVDMLMREANRIRTQLKPTDLDILLRDELVREHVHLLIGTDYESPYLKILRKLGFKGHTPKRPKRKRDEVKAIVAALLKQEFTMKEVAQKLGFKLTKDHHGNLYSKTGRRYVKHGKSRLRALRRDFEIDFRFDEGGLPEMYIGDICLSQIPLAELCLKDSQDPNMPKIREFIIDRVELDTRVRSLYKQALERERGAK